ncbi:MAG TPA: hypothetical protein VN809_14385, partial [Telmatospirillum sp.]|nr:hypothetical protein [Telmatospirillum sp.]
LTGGNRSHEGIDVSRLIAEMTESVRALEVADADLIGPRADVERDSQLIGNALAEAVHHVSGHPESVQGLRQVTTRLQELASLAPQNGIEDPRLIKEKVLALTKGRYTMAREHEIQALFDQIDGGGLDAVRAKKVDTVRTAVTDIDDFLF